jgi:hypothetical protein
MSSNGSKPVLALLPSYLAAIKHSVGTELFRSLYFHIDSQVVDVLDDGDLSCAHYLSSMMYMFGLIPERHTTVKSTIEDMQVAGWHRIPEPRPGAVIHWDFKKKDDGTQGAHHHLGFYIDAETAISNSSDTRIIVAHHPTYGSFENGEPRRDILAFYWHDSLM